MRPLLFSLIFSCWICAAFSQTISGVTSLCQGPSTTLTVTGAPAGSTYQWQQSTDGGATWTNIPGATASSYNVTALAFYTVIVTTNGVAKTLSGVEVVQSQKPTAAFTFTPGNICSNVPVSFTDGSGGSVTGYSWTFGDPNSGSNNNSTDQNPSHRFVGVAGNNTQSFNTKLVVATPLGCKDSITKVVTTKQLPGTQLSGTGKTTYNNLPYFTQCNPTPSTFTFSNASGTSNSSYQISWGDNTPDFASTSFSAVTHTYNVGTFTLQFIVNGTNGCSDTGTYYVFVGSNPTGSISSPGSTVGCSGETFQFPFSNISGNPPGTQYFIFVNDGTPDTIKFTQANVPAVFTHTFNNASCGIAPNNTFTVSYLFSNPCGETPGTIGGIRISKKASAAFTISPKDTVCQNTAITFTNVGNAGSTVPNTGGGSCTAGKFVWQVSPATGWTIISGTLGADKLSSDVDLWDPGTTPLRLSFNAAGVYTIKLKTGTNKCGLDSIVKMICVNPTPTGTLDFTQPTNTCAPVTFAPTATASTTNCGANTLTWGVYFTPASGCTTSNGVFNYLNGTNANSTEPVFQLVGAGTYTIRDTIYSPGRACYGLISLPPITVKGRPNVTLNVPASACENSAITPTATASCNPGSTFSYLWSLNGGSPASSTQPNPGAVTYSNPGNYNISVDVSNECGTTTSTKTVSISPLPDLTVPASLTLCAGGSTGPLLFSSATTGVTYSWTNSNPSIGLAANGSSNPIPSFTAVNNSTLPVSATITVNVRTATNCSRQKTFTITVNPRPVITNQSVTVCSGASFSVIPTTTTIPAGTTYSWAAPTVTGGLTGGSAGSGQTTISGTLMNPTTTAQSATYTVTPTSGAAGTCIGTSFTVIVTVNASPVITGTFTDPSSCTVSNGSIALSGLRPNTAYSVQYTKNSGTPTTVNLTSNASGVITISGLSAGSYSNISVTLNNCPSNAVGPFTLTSPSAPATPIAGSNSPLCSGSTLNLTASGGASGAVYNWTGPNGFTSNTQNPVRPSATTTMGGTYSVTITLNGCVSSPATVNVVVNATPGPPAVTTPVSYCQNEVAAPLSATALPGYTLGWYTVATGGTASTTAPVPSTGSVGTTTYYVSQTNTTTTPACESVRTSIAVIVRALPLITGTFTDPLTCTSSDGTIRLNGLTANTAYSVQYTKNSGTPITVNLTSNASGVITISGLSAGSYSNISVTLNNCSSNVVGPFTLTSPSAPATPAAGSNSPLCSGSTLNLTASGGASGAVYNWTGPNGFTSNTQNPIRPSATTTMSGTYSVTITLNGCVSSPATVNVMVNATPAPPAVTTPVSYCQNEVAAPLSATALPGYTLGWYTVATGGTASTTAPVPSTGSVGTTTYYVSQTNTTTTPACESVRASIAVIVRAVPLITGTFTDPLTCTSSDGTIRLNGLTANTAYSVQYTKNSGTPITVNLTSNASGVITISGLSAGSYSNISVTLNNCSSNAVGPFTLTSPSAPASPVAGSNSPLCSGSTLNLTASGGAGGAVYNWTGPNGFTSNTQNPIRPSATTTMSGTYSVTITLNGCVSSPATVNVVVNATPGPPVVATPVNYCQNEVAAPLSATALPGYTLGWYTVATGGTAGTTAPVPSTGSVGTTTYYVSQTSTTTTPACESVRTSIAVIVRAVPLITGTFTDPLTCTSSDGTIRLNGLTANTAYSVQYTKNSGTPTTVNLTSNASGVITISGLSAGSYSNISVTLNNCSSNAVGPFTLTSPPAPASPVAGSNSPLCSGSTLNLTASGGASGAVYNWTGPNGFTSNIQNPSIQSIAVSGAGQYSVVATINGCSSPPVKVDVVVNSAGIVQATNNGPLCAGNSLQLTASNTVTVGSYSWSGPNGFSSSLQNPIITGAGVSAAGTYTVNATSLQGSCTSLSSTNVVISPIPNISNAGFTDPVNCTAATGYITLNGLTPNTSYAVQYSRNGTPVSVTSLPSDGSGTITITNLPGATYSNIAVLLNGCASNVVGPFTLVNANPAPPAPKASGNSPLCIGSTLTLSAAGAGNLSYEWTGPNGFASTAQNPAIPQVTPLHSGKYYVIAKLNNCTSQKDSVEVLIGDYPTVNLGPDLLVTPGTQQQLKSVIQNGPITQYLWSPATNLSCTTCPTPVATIQSDISYTLMVKNSYGCGASDTINLRVSCDQSQVFFPNAFTPDGDGINDLLIIRAAGSVTIKYFRIFNKWGEMVFEKMNFPANDASHAWDGRVKGIIGPPEVYVYTAQVLCSNGGVFTYKGNISVLK